MNLYEKIERLCEKKGINITTMCQQSGVNRSSLTDLKMGRKQYLSSESVKKLAVFFDVTSDYLLGTNNESSIEAYGFMPVSKRKIPMLGNIACGQPIYTNEERDSYVMIGTNLDVDFCLRAQGDSMTGARIMDGDIVFIKRTSSVDNGDIAAVIVDDEATLKRVYFYPQKGKLILQAENPKYPPLIYEGEELNHIYIIGRAVAFQSDVI